MLVNVMSAITLWSVAAMILAISYLDAASRRIIKRPRLRLVSFVLAGTVIAPGVFSAVMTLLIYATKPEQYFVFPDGW